MATRAQLESLRRKVAELKRREERKRQSADGGLMHFVRCFWHILEPKTPFVEGWAFEAICLHLEAVTRGDIKRLLINVPPGFSKSLLVNVFWPAWEWSAKGMAHTRWVTFAYGAHLTIRDNEKFRNLISSPEFRKLWGDQFSLTLTGVIKVANDKTGSKFASSVNGIVTGERGNRSIVDDPHNVVDGESDIIRQGTVMKFDEAISNRLNDLATDAIVVIMQRVHQADVSGFIIENEHDYVHLMIPMEYDCTRHCVTSIGWEDPRTEDGELAWPERYPEAVLGRYRRNRDLWAGQYQQLPAPRGGNIFRDEYWNHYVTKDGSVPRFDFVIASCDTAYTEKETNDYSACVILGVWDDNGVNKVMVLDAWQKRLILNGKTPPREAGESSRAHAQRVGHEWGLIQWMAHTCKLWGVKRLLIEGKASGISVAQEIRRQHSAEGWGTLVLSVKGDKDNRAHSTVGLFTDELVYVPQKPEGEDYRWVRKLKDEMAVFPRGQHDDMTDAIVQGLRWLSTNGLLSRHEQRAAEISDLMQYKHESSPIYEC